MATSKNTLTISKIILFIAIIAIFVSILIGVLPLYRDHEKQISLLESLHSELDAISSKKKTIKLLNKEISTKGNLQGIKELFGVGLKPAYGIWNLNTQIYVANLNRKIKGKKTKPLKDSLIHISQKIELVGNYLIQYNQIPEKIPEEHKRPIRNSIMKILNEVVGFVEETKRYIEEEFDIKKDS